MVFTQMVYTDAATLQRTFLALVMALMLSLMTAAISRPASALTVNVIPITGQLLIGGQPATGNYDLKFQLYNTPSGGSAVGSLVTVTNVAVQDGVYYAELNFGTFPYGNSLWVQSAYRPAGMGSYTIVAGRHVVPSAVYAAYAVSAGVAANTTGLGGQPVQSTVPTSGQALIFTGGSWTPTTLPAPTAYTAGAGLALTGSQFSVAVPLALTGTSSGPILQASNAGSGFGLQGSSASGTGVEGDSTGKGLSGVSGISDSGYGVSGTSTRGTGVYASGVLGGVYAITGNSSGSGVIGINSANGTGVTGTNSASGDYGFLGGLVPIANTPAGVYGNDSTSVSSGGAGVNGVSANGVGGSFTGGMSGVFGTSTAANGVGVSGVANNGQGAFGVNGVSGSGYGVYGQSTSGTGGRFTSGGANGVYAQSTATNGVGVNGIADSGITASGVFGESASGFGVYGQGPTGTGVYGQSTSGFGVIGDCDSSTGVYGSSGSGNGVEGYSTNGVGGFFRTGGSYAVDGINDKTNGIGVDGLASTGPNAIGIFGESSTGYAGYFRGNVHMENNLSVAGSITAGTKDFKIDHPLDPTGKYLYHASVESDQMTDIYNGHVILDAAGAATVTMPDWFQALNKDFEYTLTCVGGFAPVYVAQEVQNNKFQIAGGKQGMKVSWQVTGIRHDGFALSHPLQVEEDKPANEQGLYQNPDAFGQPKELGVGYARYQNMHAKK